MFANGIDPGCETFSLDVTNEWLACRIDHFRIKGAAKTRRGKDGLQSLIGRHDTFRLSNWKIRRAGSQGCKITPKFRQNHFTVDWKVHNISRTNCMCPHSFKVRGFIGDKNRLPVSRPVFEPILQIEDARVLF